MVHGVIGRKKKTTTVSPVLDHKGKNSEKY